MVVKNKRKLRETIKANLTQLSLEKLSYMSFKINKNIEHFVRYTLIERAKIAMFLPIKFEPNIKDIMLRLEHRFVVLLPKIKEDKMHFVPYRHGDPLKDHTFGFMQPVSDEYMVPEALFIPGLKFDKQGYRLGYGKGYYDSYLQEHLNVIKVGLCYQMQVVEKLPIENHDIPMDYLITESGIIRIER